MIEISTYRSDPDHFTAIATLEPGRAEYAVNSDPNWDYPLRLRVRINGEAGPIHFVTRPYQVRLRVSGRGGVRTPEIDPDQIFADERQAREWLSAVTQLALDAQPMKAGTPRLLSDTLATEPIEGGNRGSITWDDPAAWHKYLDDAAERLGEPMLSFALGGLPRIAFTSGLKRAVWEDDFLKHPEGDADPATAGHPDEGLQDPAAEVGASITPRELGSEERHRLRRWLGDLVKPIPGIPAIDRLARGRLMLRATRMKMWETETEAGWFELLLTAASNLPDDDIPPQLQGEMGALAQVAIYEVAAAAQQIGRSRPVGRLSAIDAYLETERALGALLQPVDKSALERCTDILRAKGTIPPDPSFIAHHAATVIAADPTEHELRRLLLLHPDLVVTRAGNAILAIETLEANPLPACGRCLNDVTGDWALLASSSRGGRRAFAARFGTTMVTAAIPNGNTKVRYKSYVLGPLVSPIRVAESEVNLPGSVRASDPPPHNEPGRLGLPVLTHLGVDPLKVEEFLQVNPLGLSK